MHAMSLPLAILFSVTFELIRPCHTTSAHVYAQFELLKSFQSFWNVR